MPIGEVKDIYEKDYVTIQENEPLSHVLSLIKRKHPPELVVVDDRDEYVGVLPRRKIALARVDPATTKISSLMRKAPAVDVNDSVEHAARLMLENEIRKLPVFQGKKLVGFVTNINLIHGAVLDDWGNTEISKIMTKNPVTVDVEDSVGIVIDIFQDHGFNHLPVMQEGKLAGIVSGEDIVRYLRKPKNRQTLGERVGEKIARLSIPVRGIMAKPVIKVPPDTPLKAADKKMHKYDISSLVVVGDKKAKPIGIVTRRDFLEPLAQMDFKQLKIYAQFSIKDDVEVRAIERKQMMDDFDSFAERYGEVLKSGGLFVYMKSHGANYKGDQLIHCRLQLRTRIGAFYSASEGWDVEQTFRIALDRLERQILRSKELEFDAQFAHTYLERLGIFKKPPWGGE